LGKHLLRENQRVNGTPLVISNISTPEQAPQLIGHSHTRFATVLNGVAVPNNTLNLDFTTHTAALAAYENGQFTIQSTLGAAVTHELGHSISTYRDALFEFTNLLDAEGNNLILTGKKTMPQMQELWVTQLAPLYLDLELVEEQGMVQFTNTQYRAPLGQKLRGDYRDLASYINFGLPRPTIEEMYSFPDGVPHQCESAEPVGVIGGQDLAASPALLVVTVNTAATDLSRWLPPHEVVNNVSVEFYAAKGPDIELGVSFK